MKMIGFRTGPVLRQYMIAIVANFTMLQFGLDIAWLSPVVMKLKDSNQTVLPEPLTDDEGAWLVSVGNLACFVGMPITGYLANRFGRKGAMILGTIPNVMMCFIFIFASRFWMMIVGRLLAGLTGFIILPVTATYTSEIASKETRGALGTVSQIMAGLGSTLLLTIGPFVSYMTLQIITTGIVCATTLFMLFLPETPYYLYSRGRTGESIKVLTYLRGSKVLACEEVNEYSLDNKTNTDIKEILQDTIVLKTIGKVIILAILAQLIGYNMIFLYLQSIFESAHTSVTSEVSSLVSGCIQLFACFCTLLLTDSFGRKPILNFSLAGLTVGMVGLGTFFKLAEYSVDSEFLNYLPLISIALMIFSYNAGLGSLFWMLIAELFDSRFRATGVSIGSFFTVISLFLTSKYFPSVSVDIGPAAMYWTFGGFNVLTALFISFCLPETGGKAFSQIQREMGRKEIEMNKNQVNQSVDSCS